MNDALTIAILTGTVRANRESIKAAHYIENFGKSLEGVEVVLVDPQELMLIDEGEDVKDPTYTDITSRADAFIIVTPEYNHSFPGSLKRMLDSEYDNYQHKPVGLVGVSNGSWGGVRVCEALLPVCHRLGLVNIHSELYFPRIQNMFEENNSLKAEFAEQYEKNTAAMYKEILWFAQLLKSAKQQT